MTTEAFPRTRPARHSSSAGETEALRARSLAGVAAELAEREGRDDPVRTAQIARWCNESGERFRGAPIQAYVPVLVHHIVRERMSTS